MATNAVAIPGAIVTEIGEPIIALNGTKATVTVHANVSLDTSGVGIVQRSIVEAAKVEVYFAFSSGVANFD